MEDILTDLAEQPTRTAGIGIRCPYPPHGRTKKPYYRKVPLQDKSDQRRIALERRPLLHPYSIDIHRHLPDEPMKAMVPQFQTAAYDLFFNDSISVYKATPKDEAPESDRHHAPRQPGNSLV